MDRSQERQSRFRGPSESPGLQHLAPDWGAHTHTHILHEATPNHHWRLQGIKARHFLRKQRQDKTRGCVRHCALTRPSDAPSLHTYLRRARNSGQRRWWKHTLIATTCKNNSTCSNMKPVNWLQHLPVAIHLQP